MKRIVGLLAATIALAGCSPSVPQTQEPATTAESSSTLNRVEYDPSKHTSPDDELYLTLVAPEVWARQTPAEKQELCEAYEYLGLVEIVSLYYESSDSMNISPAAIRDNFNLACG